MVRRKRLWPFLFVIAAVLAVVFLSAGLSGVELLPGHPLPRDGKAGDSFQSLFSSIPTSEICLPIFSILYFVFVLLTPFAIFYVIVSPEARKRVLRSLGLMLWLLALYFVMRARPELFEQLTGGPIEAPPMDDVALPSFEFAANPPQWIVWGTTLLLALLVAAGVVAVAVHFWRRAHRPKSTLDQLAQEAQEALAALESGADLRNVVMRCYFEMSRVLIERKGIAREKAMTPREFERALVETGLPGSSVRQLTRLFEDVRYGTKVPGKREERMATDCLADIVKACGGVS
jgi:hypothetical protein